jgi:hypothetical protein
VCPGNDEHPVPAQRREPIRPVGPKKLPAQPDILAVGEFFRKLFSAGKSGKKDSSPGGTAEFSRTLPKGWQAQNVLSDAALSDNKVPGSDTGQWHSTAAANSSMSARNEEGGSCGLHLFFTFRISQPSS